MMTKYIIDEECLAFPFSERQIKYYAKENSFTRLQSILYLWAFNNFSVHYPDDLENFGRPMYRKLAKNLSDLFEQCAIKEQSNED